MLHVFHDNIDEYVDKNCLCIRLVLNINFQEMDEFDTVIVGPWMTQWEIVHQNRHTMRLAGDHKTSWHAGP